MTLTPCFILRVEHMATTSKFGRSYVAFCNQHDAENADHPTLR